MTLQLDDVGAQRLENLEMTNSFYVTRFHRGTLLCGFNNAILFTRQFWILSFYVVAFCLVCVFHYSNVHNISNRSIIVPIGAIVH
jgi:hypothetical protein